MPFFDFGRDYPRLGAVRALLWCLCEVDRRIRHPPYITLYIVEDIERWISRGLTLLTELVDAYEEVGDEFPDNQVGGNIFPRMR